MLTLIALLLACDSTPAPQPAEPASADKDAAAEPAQDAGPPPGEAHAPPATLDGDSGHCKPDETAVFSCYTEDGTLLSLCGGQPEVALVQYRQGRRRMIKTFYPTHPSAREFTYGQEERQGVVDQIFFALADGTKMELYAQRGSRTEAGVLARGKGAENQVCKEVSSNHIVDWARARVGTPMEGMWSGPGWVLTLKPDGTSHLEGMAPCGVDAGDGTWAPVREDAVSRNAELVFGDTTMYLGQPATTSSRLMLNCEPQSTSYKFSLKRRQVQ